MAPGNITYTRPIVFENQIFLTLRTCPLLVLYYFSTVTVVARCFPAVCPRPLIYCLRQQPLILSKRRQTSEENICFPWHRIIYERMQVLMLNELNIMRCHMCFIWTICLYVWIFMIFQIVFAVSIMLTEQEEMFKACHLVEGFSKEDICATIIGCQFLTLKRNQFLPIQSQPHNLCKSQELWGFKFGLLIDHSALPSIRKLYIPGNFGYTAS